jgi:hypothetical protein
MNKDLKKGIDWVVNEAERIKESLGLSGQIDHWFDNAILALKYIDGRQCGNYLKVGRIDELLNCRKDRKIQDRLRIEINFWFKNVVIPDIRAVN